MKTDILIYFLGIVFLSAGIHRIFYKSQREYESLKLLGLPIYSDYIILMIEIICGLILLFGNKKWVNLSLTILLIMSLIGCILLAVINKENIIKTYHELFTFKDTSMSFFLHITYMIIILFILFTPLEK